MNEFILNTKPFLEWGSLLSTIVLCFAAIYGLKQIRLLKIDILSRSERSAKEKAIEASERFLGDCLNTHSAFVRQLEVRNLGEYDGAICEFKFTESKEWPKECQKRYQLQRHWLLTFNKMEAIAAVFITGVADEQTGFEVIGLDFVDIVRRYYDIYTLCQKNVGEGNQNFPNTIKLYKTWSPRFTEKELQRQKGFLEEKLRSLEKLKIPQLKPDIC